ncbi:hypothetical protein [Achromobacter piechaudii]|nr:hypothetical protein [Achromobacter piechaudii]
MALVPYLRGVDGAAIYTVITAALSSAGQQETAIMVYHLDSGKP